MVADLSLNKEQLKSAVYEANYGRNSFAGLLGPAIFFAFCFFDYVLSESEFLSFFMIRMSVFSLSLVFYGLRKTSWFFERHMIFLSGILLSLLIGMSYICFQSDYPILQLSGLGLILVLFPLIFVAELKYCIPSFLTAIVSMALYYPHFQELTFNTKVGVLFFFPSALLVSMVSLHMRFQSALESQKCRIDLLETGNALAKATSEKEKLNHVVTNDLFNSLALLKGNLFLMQRGIKDKVDEKRLNQILKKLERACLHQEEVIEHVKMTQDLSNGTIKLKNERVMIKDVVQKTLELFEEKISEKEIDFKVQINDPQLAFLGDEVAFRNQVLNNLISNAIKFSHNGGKVILSAISVGSTNVEISLRDYGTGIGREFLSALFDNKLDRGLTHIGTSGEAGSGYGLSIVKKYLDLMGGEIIVDSREEEKENSGETTIILRLNRAFINQRLVG